MTENKIRVVDKNGNTLAPTYQRRARGLVKSGRAEWTSLDRTEICLLDAERSIAPPDDNTEENNMTTNDLTKVEVTEEDYREIKQDKQLKPTLTVEYILEKMEQIRLDTAHTEQALEMFRNFTVNECPNGGIGDAERAKAILEIVKCRETTLQRELAMLERMYDDLTRDDEAEQRRKMLGIATDCTLTGDQRDELIRMIKY